MVEKCFQTRCGEIHYWVNEGDRAMRPTLVFLPGLTADHRLFEKQIEYFQDKYPFLVWDAPGHGVSWPFTFDFDLMEKAGWLHELLAAEGIERPVLIGQSMGGYVGQAYLQQFPGTVSGFVAIDSAPLQRQYTTAVEIWLLKRMEPVYRHYPWKSLLKSGSSGVAETEYGRNLMHEIMMTYDGDQARYAKLSGHGFQMLAEAMEADLPYKIDCPALLLCGEKDKAGSAKRYNQKWHDRSGLSLVWIPNAGHNSNTDQPKLVNHLLETFLEGL